MQKLPSLERLWYRLFLSRVISGSAFFFGRRFCVLLGACETLSLEGLRENLLNLAYKIVYFPEDSRLEENWQKILSTS